NLRIDEVSTVDRGAGRGVRVVLAKRDSEAEGSMTVVESFLKSAPGIGTMTVAKKLHEDAASGKISEYRFAELQQQMASGLFPNDPPGIALSKFFATPAGAETLRPRPRLTAAENSEIMKREYTRPKAQFERPDDDVEEPATKLEKLVAEHMQRAKC